jgi:thiamine-phosphate pyrophosphorylase
VHLEEAKDAGLFTVASAHSIDEARSLERRGVDVVTLSPIFPSPGKGTPLGLNYLRKAMRELKVPIIALGGIVTPEHLEDVWQIGAYGFASIRYFDSVSEEE